MSASTVPPNRWQYIFISPTRTVSDYRLGGTLSESYVAAFAKKADHILIQTESLVVLQLAGESLQIFIRGDLIE